jgi:myosin heavy subunit
VTDEQTEYKLEGIFWDPIIPPDNQATIDSIMKGGMCVISLLNSACKGPAPRCVRVCVRIMSSSFITVTHI